MSTLKPVIYLKINGKDFHSATSPYTPNAVITSFSFEDTDGTDTNNTKKKGKRDELKFSFIDYDPETKSFRSDTSTFRVGNLVSFRFGFEGIGNLSKEKLLKIVNVETTFPQGLEIATVTCHDKSKQMNVEQRNVVRPTKGREANEKTQYTLHSVIKECAEEAGLKYKSTDPFYGTLQMNGWQQKNETNIKFLARIAQDYGADVYVEGNLLYFTRKKRVIKQYAWGYLHRGENADYFNLINQNKRVALMLDFSPKVNLEEAASEVENSDLNSEKNEETTKKSQKPTDPMYTVDEDTVTMKPEEAQATDQKQKSSKKVKQAKAPRTEAEAKAQAEAEQQQSSESAITATATCLGDPRLKAKTTVITTGRLSKKWRGQKWYVQSCKHSVTSSGYACDLDLTAPPKIASTNKKDTADSKKQDGKAANTETKKCGVDQDLVEFECP